MHRFHVMVMIRDAMIESQLGPSLSVSLDTETDVRLSFLRALCKNSFRASLAYVGIQNICWYT